MESRVNEAGRFLLCSVTDGEGKRHKIFFPEGMGLVKGWSILAEKSRALGIKGKQKEKVVEKSKEGILVKGLSFAEVVNLRKTPSNAAWVDAGESVPRKAMGTLNNCLVGTWKTPPASFPTVKEVKAWARGAWRLKGNIPMTYMNNDFLLEFTFPKEAMWVLESSRRTF